MRGTRLRNYQLILLLLGLGFGLPATANTASEPLRVASMNYCIDFVLERWQQQTDANYELYTVPQHQGRIEQMLSINPDIIIAGQFNSPITLSNFRNHGLPVIVLAEPNSFETAAEFYHLLATAIKQPHLAEHDITALTAPQRLGSVSTVSDTNSSVPELQPKQNAAFGVGTEREGSVRRVTDPILSAPILLEQERPGALALQANQWSFGGNNLLNEVLEYLRLENLAARSGDGLVRVSLEDVIAWQPKVLLLDGDVRVSSEHAAENEQQAPKNFALANLNLMHKSLRNYQARSDVHTIYLPRELSGCMAQRLPEAIAILTLQLEQYENQQ